MARLNTTKPPGTNEPRRQNLNTKPSWHEAKTPTKPATKETKQWTRSTETTTKSGTPGITAKPSLPKSQSQKIGKGSGGFELFYDNDAVNESDGLEDGPPPNDSHPKKTQSPLKLARTNSLQFPVPHQARNRRPRKSEMDYDKENDYMEDNAEEHVATTATTPSRLSSPRMGGGARGLPRINSSLSQLWDHRETGDSSGGGSDDSEDNGFDSLDDFIVSDGDEISYHDTSEDETDQDEVQSPPPPPSRRRLFRGRRPAAEGEVLESPAEREHRPESSLPTKRATSPLNSDSRQATLSQEGSDIAEEMDRLTLGNNADFSQLHGDFL